ncbi:hypothetical protein CACET_c30610 [Clostridium aceticum]|uniref:Uncharacterized protein n=1 Tax=Clostridium aceticum TaxID=84022 RepID=A0A0D8IB90_9CLOT|nr:3-keto-5-aminohexanoate cleavage protein [Clostridium aceticum]AKL96505.1 hypothetical protein CACET_c30610 [Clostridium aceticum]KJF27324.1 3-keto-5-aminohexanoate cleavage protein [Clostridium aceticum]
MRKALISVAPVSASSTNIDPAEIANDVIQCSKAGAGMVHLHVRDKNGKLTSDMTVLNEIIGLIRKECDIIIQASTGGISDLTIEERCVPVMSTLVESNSLNVGSVNLGDAVYLNPIKDVRYCVDKIIKNNKIPEIEVFEIGMIKATKDLTQEFNFVKPMLFSIVLGHIGASPATVRTLRSLIDSIDEFFPNKEEVLWGITHANRKSFDIIETALDLGASTVRIGFEDSNFLDEVQTAKNNYLLVEEIARIIKNKGMLPYTPDEARKLLRIK